MPWRFESGHRIRLSITSADFPNLWPTPCRATNRLYRNASHKSRLELPIVPTKPVQNEVTFKPAEKESDIAAYDLSPGEPVWQILQDVIGDRVGLITGTRDVSRVSESTEVTNIRELEVWVENESPADVSAVGKHLRKIVRRDGTTNVDAVCNLRSTEEAFHITIDLSITVNGLPHHTDRWVRSFPRNLL